MTRVLQVMAGSRLGGAEAFFERLAGGLASVGETQRLVIRENLERAARLRVNGIDVIELPFRGVFDFKTGPMLKRAILDFKPEVVLSWMNRATKFCPRGDFVHAARLGGYYNLKYYRYCDHLIGNTHGIVDYLRDEGWPVERTHYLPNFVTVEKAEPISRAALDTPEGAPVILALGRLHRNKGFDVLLEALAQLPNFHLWLAGEGPEEMALKAQAAKLAIGNRVHFLGWREDIEALFASVNIFACSSRHEPLGNVVIEAWAAGVPVVAAESPGPRELIRNGETGLLVPVENADALAAALKNIADNNTLSADLVLSGRTAYEKEFSEVRVVGLYQEFFDKVKR